MKRLLILVLFLLFGLAILATGCNSSSDTAEDVEAVSEVVAEVPTSLPEATATPEPTSTPEPTATPTPMPELVVLVTDDESGDPLIGAVVELSHQKNGSRFSRETDDDGLVVFASLPRGEFNVKVSAAGYYDDDDEEIAVTGPVDMECPMTKLAMAEITVETATLRAGPGTVYNRKGQIEEGERVEIINQSEDGEWYLVELGEEDETAWLNGEDASVSGAMDRIEAIEAPPVPTPAPAAPTAVPEPETAETMVLYYISNPNDILGVFPIRPFNPAEALSKMQVIRGALYTMRDALPGARSGDAAACVSYINAYNNILYSGVYYEPVPPEWQDIDNYYYLSFVYSLDRTRPAFLSCVNAGRVDDFNASLAEQTIGETLGVLEPAINSAASRQ